MKRKTVWLIVLTLLPVLTGCGENDRIQRTEWSHTFAGYPVVYVTQDVSANGLLSAYKSLDASFDGPAAIKLPEPDTNKGWTELIGELSESLNGPVIVETTSSVDFSDYACTIVLSRFISHDTYGFNGAVKQTAIISTDLDTACCLPAGQGRLEKMAENGKETVDSLDGHILYINIMDRVTIESAGVSESSAYDIGILASYDPIALDQACIDLASDIRETTPLLSNIDICDGLHTLIYGEQIGLGSRTYVLAPIDI